MACNLRSDWSIDLPCKLVYELYVNKFVLLVEREIRPKLMHACALILMMHEPCIGKVYRLMISW